MRYVVVLCMMMCDVCVVVVVCCCVCGTTEARDRQMKERYTAVSGGVEP